MTVDLRAIVACDLGPIISGSVGSNHISDRSGLEMLSGRLTLDGLFSPARGTAINLLVACPQLGRITRFPKVLRVIRSTSYPLDNRTEVEVGCRLTLLKELKQQEQYFPGSGAISTQAVLTYCLSQLGITMAAGSPTLSRQLLRSSIDLSGGYVRVIGDLIRSECAFGRLRPDETFEVVPINMSIGGAGPVLTADDLVSFEPITTGSEPPDQYQVTYSAAQRGSATPGSSEQEQQQADNFWTFSENYSDPERVYVFYTDLNNIEREYVYPSRTYNSSQAWYELFSYKDANGKRQQTEVMTHKVDRKRSTAASLNGSYVSELLRYGFRNYLPLGEAETVDETFYVYKSTPDGPIKVQETTTHTMSWLEFAGNLSIPSYVGSDGTGYFIAYIPSLNQIKTTITQINYDTFTESTGRVLSRTSTSRWIAKALTQQGQHDFNTSIKNVSINSTAAVVSAFSGLGFEGTEVQTEAAKPPIATRPSAQERRARVISASSDTTTQRTITGNVLFTAGQLSNDISTTTTYDMPYAPDDISAAGFAVSAAHRFGQTEAALDVGHAYGYNIVTSFDRIPTLHMGPLYVRLAGLEAAFLTDSLSYAFDASGMVVSSDLMLLGTTGYYGASAPISSWVRLPVPVAGLQAAGAATVEASPAKANSIAYLNGFDPINPAAAFDALGSSGTDVFAAWKAGQHLIGPTVALDAEALATGPVVTAIDYAYALDAGTDVANLATGPVSEFAWVTTISAPTAALTMAALAPKVSTGARVVVPAAALTVAGTVPAVSSGASIAVPTAAVVLAGVDPDLVGRQKTIINVPTAAVAVAGQAPAVRRGAAVVVPVASIAVAGVVPVLNAGSVDPNFTGVSLLLHMDGSNNSTTFADSSSNGLTMTVVGDSKISTAQSKFGGAAAYFDGNGDYINTPSSTLFDFGGGNSFTIEFWIYTSNAQQVYGGLVSQRISSTPYAPFDFMLYQGGLRLLVGNAAVNSWAAIPSIPSIFSNNTWYHVALVGDGTNLKAYVNGSSVLTQSQPSWTSANRVLYIGKGGDGAFQGYIDDLRVTKGIARTITVPTVAYPDR